jgi:short-subunit dehydrogenase
LHHDLALAASKLKVSVVCPWWVKTAIFDSDRNRPAALQNEPAAGEQNRRDEMMEKMSRQTLAATGQNPSEVAGMVFEAVRDERFYVITHPEIKDRVRTRMEDILEGRNPVFGSGF